MHICEVALKGCCWLGECEDTVMNTTVFLISFAEVFFLLFLFTVVSTVYIRALFGEQLCLFVSILAGFSAFPCISSISSS